MPLILTVGYNYWVYCRSFWILADIDSFNHFTSLYDYTDSKCEMLGHNSIHSKC